MAKPKLLIFTGNIGSGKTTLAKTYVEDGYVAIARDQLRYVIGEGKYIWNDYYESIIWSTEQFMFKAFCNLGVNIVVDEVGISKKMRFRYIEYGKICGYNIKAIVLPRLSMKEAVDRRIKNPHGQYDRKVWEHVYSQFDSQYQEPTNEEGFDEIINLTGGIQ